MEIGATTVLPEETELLEEMELPEIRVPLEPRVGMDPEVVTDPKEPRVLGENKVETATKGLREKEVC